MNLQPHPETERRVVSTNNAQVAPFPGAFFPNACGFTIGGGAFTNVTNNVYNLPQEHPTAFRTILRGDIRLMSELRSNGRAGVVGRQNQAVGVRRMYSAEHVGVEIGPVMVAIYQEAGAEEKWRQHLAKYESVWHPNLMQLYGLVNTSQLHAMVFYNNLVPYRQFLRRFRHSPLLTAYVINYSTSEWIEAKKYIASISATPETDYDLTPWIRSTTGELCVDIVMDVANQIDDLPIFVKWPLVEIPRSESVSMDDPDVDLEAAIISTLSGDTYHKLCSEPPLAQLRILPVSNQLPVRLGTIMIFSSNSQYGTLSRIIEPLPIRLGCESSISNMQYHCGRDYHGGDVLANSWIRFRSHQVRTLNLSARVRRSDEACKSWLAQATGIFTQLQITSRLENYVFVRGIQFTLRLLRHTYNTHEPDGYLFVCPPENFRTGPDAFQWPGCPAYWSHDPSGATRFSTEDATILGFPMIHIETVIHGLSWNNSVYDGLQRFHRYGGFDPDSQEAAIHPLYKLSSDVVVPLPCVDGEGCDFSNSNALCQTLGHYL